MNPNHPLLQEEFTRIAALPLPWENLNGKRIAVTGATGLVGSYLCYALDFARRDHGLNFEILALCRKPTAAKERLHGDFRFEKYDATLPLPQGFHADVIFHAASNAHPVAFSSDPVGTMQANILGAMDFLNQLHGGRFILFSTGEIYGEMPGLDGFDEQTFGSVNPMSARACYPESKRAAETLCAAYAQQYGADALAARFTYVYGPTITAENSRADAQFLRKALSGENIVMKSEGAQVRSYTYVADAVSGLLYLLFHGEAAQAYNVANPACAVSIRNYAETLAELAGVRVVFDLPPEAERRGYSTVSRAVLKSGKLQDLGWQPEYSLREGLRHTLEISKN